MNRALIWGLIVALSLSLGIIWAANADAASVEPVAQEASSGNVDWAYLGTSAGAVAATLLIVQLLKAPLDTIFRIPTRMFVYIVSLAIMLCATLFTTGVKEVGDILLIAFNAVGVSLSTMGAYELTFAKIDS